MPRTVAIIPARGGSKGIPRKNIKLLAGKPLLYYSIKAALDATSIDEVYVSTEDKQIAEIAESFGAKVIHRPVKLADDTASTFSVLHHAFNELDSPDIVVVLQPTSPLRTSRHIDEAVKLLDKDVDTVVGVCGDKKYIWEENHGTAIALFSERLPRQGMKKRYVENGALYVTRSKVYLENNGKLGMGISSTGKIQLYKMDDIFNIQVDNDLDWLIIESIMQKQILNERLINTSIKE